MYMTKIENLTHSTPPAIYYSYKIKLSYLLRHDNDPFQTNILQVNIYKSFCKFLTVWTITLSYFNVGHISPFFSLKCVDYLLFHANI